MAQLEKLCEFLSRSTGKTVKPTTSVALSSARKAQLAAWLRREKIPFVYGQIDKATITPAEIVGGELGGAVASKPAAPSTVASPAPEWVAATAPFPPAEAGGSSFLSGGVPMAGFRIGIDMESRSNLPEAEDFRSHSFYIENFSARELAHCLQAGEPMTSLCGLWAAKEAIIKAGAARRVGTSGLASIEIWHDGSGAPHFPGCALSISHQEQVAVAVCLHLAGATS